MKVPLLDLKAQFAPLREEILSAVADVFDSQWFILGPEVEALEEEIAAYCGTAHAVGVGSGSDALLLGLMALKAGPGDAVITTPYTFFATAGSISRVGATPVFVDIEADTYNLCPECLAEYFETQCDVLGGNVIDKRSGAQVRGILPVHLYGQCAEMEAIQSLAEQHGLWVLEDAAQAIGARYHDRPACSMGIAGCLSFFPSKNLGGAGEGGMVVTDDEDLARELRALRNHGSHVKYYYETIGCNARLDALQAAVLRIKLKHLGAWRDGRAANAARYDAAFSEIEGVVTPEIRPYNHSVYNQYVVRIDREDGARDELFDHLKNVGVGCDIYYPVPLHLQQCYAQLGYQEGDFPVSERAAQQSIALPIYAELTDEQQDHVISVVTDFMKGR